MQGIIYTYTNTLTGLVYVGQTTQPAVRRQTYALQAASTQPNPRCIIQAMQAAGLDAFTYQVLAEASTKDDLNRLEIHFIAALQANHPQYGYNRTVGGEGGPAGLIHSAEAKAKMSQAARGHTVSAETRAKIAQAKRGRGLGRTHSAEAKAKMSQAKRGKPLSAETRAKLSLAKRGKTLSAEHKAKIAQANRAMTAETRAKIAQTLRGKTHSAETRAKMSLAARRRAIKKIPPVVHMCVEEGQA